MMVLIDLNICIDMTRIEKIN